MNRKLFILINIKIVGRKLNLVLRNSNRFIFFVFFIDVKVESFSVLELIRIDNIENRIVSNRFV